MKKQIVLLAALGASFFFYRCGNGPKTETAGGTTDTTFSFTAMPNPPADVPANAGEMALVQYAWQEFLALNWQSSYAKDSLKDHPDTTWQYKTDTLPFPETVVWETYAHRTELSPFYYPLRPFDSLCKYSYQNAPVPGAPGALFGLLHNLDETSEIGSCNMFAYTNRFSNNIYADSFIARYQAKVNKVEYNYIKDSFASQASLNFADSITGNYYDSIYVGRPIARQNKMITLPNGSIEVKSAWRLLSATDDATKYFRRKVIMYSYDPATKKFSYYNRYYALIGLHIIHKSPNHPSFVFATWEHVDVTKDSMQYVLLTQNEKYDSLGFKPVVQNRISRYSDLATKYVHDSLLPRTSIWRNYRLVGVQGTPTNDVAAPNFFLANYVIESDSLLARFHGSGFAHPFDKGNNVVYNNTLYSVGGCQGCHGAGAQHAGSDFSFIVDAPNTNPDKVAGKPLPPTDSMHTKLGLLKAKTKFR